MRTFLTSLLIATSSATSAPVCTELPAGFYQATIGHNKYITISAFSPTEIYVRGTYVRDDEDSMDAEDMAKWNKVRGLLNSAISMEMQPDCTFKISPTSANAWRNVFVVLTDYVGQYAAIDGFTGKYDPAKNAVILGGWYEMPKIN